MLDIQMTWERSSEGKWISELSQGQKEIGRLLASSLAPTVGILSSGYIKFSTLFVLSVFGAPICPRVNSCLFLFRCLNDCCSMFRVEKKKKLNLDQLAFHLLTQSQFTQQRLIQVAPHLRQESSTNCYLCFFAQLCKLSLWHFILWYKN